MKLAKMSMVAALLLGANAYAIENVKVSGDARLYYHTDDSEDAEGNGGFLSQDSSAAQAALNLGLTADLTKGVSAGVAMTALSTLGLEGVLVDGVWEGQAGPSAVTSDYWVSEAWMATTMGKTTAKVGRQTLDTPLAFTETWSIAQNTFEAAVLINQDISDTTLVGAFIGSSNSGGGILGAGGAGTSGVVALPNIANGDSRFNTFGTNGAYAVGAINNSMKELTVQAWYYDVRSLATALWLSADLNMEGILAGVQYSTIEPAAAGADDGDVFAAMLGYEMKDVATFKVAYSQTDDTVGAGQNVAGAQTKLYTEMWWNYGTVVRADTSTILLSAEATVADIDLFASYAMSDQGNGANNSIPTPFDLNELAITASKSYGPVDTSIAIIHTDEEVAGVNAPGVTTSGAENMLQVYLTYNF